MEIVKKTPSGYKKTDVGIIPIDWSEPLCFDVLFTISGGYSASRDQLSSLGVCYLHYGDIHKSYKTYIDINNEFNVIPKLNIPVRKVSKKMLLKDGDVVFLDASEDDEGISKYVVIDNINNIDFISGLHTIVAKSKDNSLDNIYKRYCFQSNSIKSQFLFYAAGTKVTGVSKTNIKKILIAIPPLREQKAIARALSDVDELIMLAERLIEKKQNIKQGTMQELLTGENRLPGFSGDWEKVKLGKLCSITTGKLDANAMNSNGKYRFYTCAKEYYFIDNYDFDTEALLVSGNGANVGYIHYYNGKFNAYQRTYVISNITENIFYLKGYLDFYLKNRIDTEVNSGSTPYIKMDTLADMEIMLPSSKQEQKAISQILTDMDNEIEQLEVKSNKYKKIKQGMMQELLTGRIRLIDPMITKDNKVVKLKDSNLENILKVAENQPIYKGRNENFNEAVIMAVITDRFATKQYPLGSFRRQKLIYLFHRQIQESTEGFLKKAMGPYDHKLRYSIEKIAKNSGYIKEIPKSRAFVSGDKISEAKKYFNTWYCREMLEWLDQFKYKKSDELEVLTTVDMAMVELVKKGKIVNVKSIKEIIRNNKEWKPKLEKDIFNDVAIGKAMNLSNKLFD